MNILIACDSFKDALDANAVCLAVERGLRLADPAFNTRVFPLSDGGEGMSDVLHYHLGLQHRSVEVFDPLFRKVVASYGLSSDGKVAFIEMAQAAGLQLLKPEERNPLQTTTYGVGEMIVDAVGQGAKKIVLGIGGSATNDLGMGMAAALGWQFLDEQQRPLTPVGGNMGKIQRIVPPTPNQLRDVAFEVICDVKNPLTGSMGAAKVYAAQKGANEADVESLENGALHFLKMLPTDSIDSNQEGAGAAGGMGFGALFFLHARLRSGIDAMMDITRFNQQLDWADVVFTGEGRIDHQTAQGKLIAGIVARAQNKKVIALCGALTASPGDVQAIGLQAAFSISRKPCTLQDALAATAENLEAASFHVGRLLR